VPDADKWWTALRAAGILVKNRAAAPGVAQLPAHHDRHPAEKDALMARCARSNERSGNPLPPPSRTARVERKTAETRDRRRARSSTAPAAPSSPPACRSSIHMLDQVARHGLVDLTGARTGDLHIDAHHTVEDIGITIGQALRARSATRRG
jgi:hypothetical protein